LKVDEPLGDAGVVPGVVLDGEVAPGVMVVEPGEPNVPLVVLPGNVVPVGVLEVVPGMAVPVVRAVVVPGKVPLVVGVKGVRPGVPRPVVVVLVLVVVRAPEPVRVPTPLVEAVAPELEVLTDVAVVPVLAPYRPFVELSPLTMAFVGISSPPVRCIVSTL